MMLSALSAALIALPNVTKQLYRTILISQSGADCTTKSRLPATGHIHHHNKHYTSKRHLHAPHSCYPAVTKSTQAALPPNLLLHAESSLSIAAPALFEAP
jgi:hypothetical protein